MTTPPAEPPALDALLPPAMAAKAADIGVAKASMSTLRMFSLAVLAGAFIALGAMFATIATAGAAGVLPFGVTRIIAGLVFCLGLILVVVGGAELFTGNNLISIAWAERRVSLAAVLRNWGIVYAGNLVGAVIALGVFSISVISFPLLFDRDIDFVTAMSTSVRIVLENPRPMIAWCALIALLILVSVLTMFVGLIFVLPVLGHATWHLYRRAVRPEGEVVA